MKKKIIPAITITNFCLSFALMLNVITHSSANASDILPKKEQSRPATILNQPRQTTSIYDRCKNNGYCNSSYSNWDGLYVGGFLGYSQDQFQYGPIINTAKKIKKDTVEYGITARYNWSSSNQNLVFGINVDGTAHKTKLKYSNAATSINYNIEKTRYAAVKLKIGTFINKEKEFLPYISGGLQFNRYQISQTDASKTPNVSSSKKSTKVDFVIGAGVEFKLSDTYNLFIEYEYALRKGDPKTTNTEYKNQNSGIFLGFLVKI